MVLDGGIDRSVVTDAVPNEAIDTVCDLGQQRRDLGRVLLMAFRYRGRDDLPLGIHPKRPFLPALALLLPVFLRVPFPLTTDLQTRTVDDQSTGSWCGTLDVLLDDYRGIASRERRMIRAGKRDIHQSQDGMEETLRVAQRQVKEQPERERRLGRDVGIDRLGTSLAGHRCSPSRDGFWTNPEGEVAAISQRLLILAPVFDAISGLVLGVSIGSFVGLGHALHH